MGNPVAARKTGEDNIHIGITEDSVTRSRTYFTANISLMFDLLSQPLYSDITLISL